ncbi:hypothetical protein [Marinimicrobium alkaliphilum]|uniref:hypothetical protein n=1 Tax=Marinimicrobium alkaliphilum TaxID=2202654 RepID=UPI000DB9EAA1|nr:hypothetical protein [Marinimicrobium alkaliphilum]
MKVVQVHGSKPAREPGVSAIEELTMKSYCYSPYYKYNGPSLDNPLREELTAEEVQRRLELFPQELPHYFADLNADIQVRKSENNERDYVVCISVAASQSECDEQVKRCLNSLDLFADKV